MTAHAPLTQFPVENDQLMVGGMSVRALAERAGRTPFYAYDRRVISDRIAAFRKFMPGEIKLHYAMKANPMPALVAHVTREVDGIDVASSGELDVALAAGARPADISFAGPAKTEAELAAALAANILVNVESFREIRLLGQLAQNLGRRARVAIRVNPDFELKSSGMKMGGGPKQFGIDAERVEHALAEIRSNALDFEGFHVFSGSQNLRAEAICEAQAKAFDLVVRLAQHVPSPVRVINVGGGFGIPYFPGEQRLDLRPIGEQLAVLVDRGRSAFPDAQIVVELGRYLVGEAGVYVCRIIDRKLSRGRVFLVTDGGLHHHLAASGNFGQVLRKNYPVVIANRVNGGSRERASVVGPLCTPLDTLADDMDFARADEGDLVAVLQSGAYGLTASPTRFLSHPSPAEILV